MFRLIRLFISLALIAVIAIGAYFWFARVSAVEYFLSKRFGEKVTVKAVALSWNKLSIKEMKLSNPYRASMPYAFEAKEITIQVAPWHLFSKTIEIDKIEIFEPNLSVELYNQAGSDNNWTKILNGMPTEQNASKQGISPRYFTISKLSIYDLKISAKKANGKAYSLAPIPSIEFKNIGTEQPMTAYQIGKVVFMAVLHSLKPQLGDLLENVKSVPKHLLQGMDSSIPNLDEFKGKIKEQIKTLRKKSEEGSEFFHNLFSR